MQDGWRNPADTFIVAGRPQALTHIRPKVTAERSNSANVAVRRLDGLRQRWRQCRHVTKSMPGRLQPSIPDESTSCHQTSQSGSPSTDTGTRVPDLGEGIPVSGQRKVASKFPFRTAIEREASFRAHRRNVSRGFSSIRAIIGPLVTPKRTLYSGHASDRGREWPSPTTGPWKPVSRNQGRRLQQFPDKSVSIAGIPLHQSSQRSARDDSEVPVERPFVLLIGDQRMDLPALTRAMWPASRRPRYSLKKNSLGVIQARQPGQRVLEGFTRPYGWGWSGEQSDS